MVACSRLQSNVFYLDTPDEGGAAHFASQKNRNQLAVLLLCFLENNVSLNGNRRN